MDGTTWQPASQPAVERHRMSKARRRLLVALAVVLLLALVFIGTVAAMSFVFKAEGDSMLPTVSDGDRLLVSRVLPYGRGDIVVFEPPSVSDKDFFKRIVAVAGDTVEVKRDLDPIGDPMSECGGCGVYVNGVRLNEPYIRQTPNYSVERIVVPPDHVFVLGDNRRNSSDSHIFGPVEVASIKGKVVLSLIPFRSLP